jgi:GR25 family glycosyltransferase involved in LPS biosynthesis
MTSLFILLSIIFVIIVININTKVSGRSHYNYKCFLLTLKNEEKRHNRFLKSHNSEVPVEIIYGPDTRNVRIAREYQDVIEPEYFEKAVEMHYDQAVLRPDITYFNLGAIGCFMGHMEFYERCFSQNLKYAVIFEDNVVVKSHRLYDEIQKVINEKGDDFEMCFFHCLSRLPVRKEGSLERVSWISSTKCYLINVENMKKYKKEFLPMDNHIDMKHEDIIARGARVYYKDLRGYLTIDRSHRSLIGHSHHGRKEFFSRQYPTLTPAHLKRGY